MVKRNIGRTSDLVMDLLSYAKARTPEYEDCAPNDIAREVCELVREKAAAAAVALRCELDPAIGTVAMDQRSLHSVLLNLMSNAVDACRDDPDDTKQRLVTLRSAREAVDRLRFEVSDNGHGMAEEIRRKLFHSFFSTKGPQGTGLGLMVTRKAVEEHGGRIEVDSQPGRGTTFTVRLPCQAGRG
jgi:signal transduction histidine kinase